MATELSRHAGYEGQLQVERVSSVVEREFNLQLWEHVYVPPNWKAARSLWRPHSSASYLGADEAYRVVPGLPAWEVVKSYIGAACAVGKRADEDGDDGWRCWRGTDRLASAGNCAVVRWRIHLQ